MPPPDEKKKATSKSKLTPSRMTSKVAARVAVLGEGTSTNPRVDLGTNAFVLGNPGMAEKLLQGRLANRLGRAEQDGPLLGDHNILSCCRPGNP